mmetsp:Transcript_32971/g.80163  ORF Transcript_32971/g.80163 Transcript_32971/m.80163 type:complete len:201 (-) Transcript_32971:116-718(-)
MGFIKKIISSKSWSNSRSMSPRVSRLQDHLLSTGSRPDIAEAISTLSSYSNEPKKVHRKALRRVVKYLNNTKDYSIYYSSGALTAASDSTHNSCSKTSRSRTGYVCFYASGPISWKSKRQTHVTPSARDAEYVAAATCVQDIIFNRNFIQELNSNTSQSGPPTWISGKLNTADLNLMSTMTYVRYGQLCTVIIELEVCRG